MREATPSDYQKILFRVGVEVSDLKHLPDQLIPAVLETAAYKLGLTLPNPVPDELLVLAKQTVAAVFDYYNHNAAVTTQDRFWRKYGNV